MEKLIFFALLTAVFCGHDKDEWRGRTVYQLLTDRFSRGKSHRGGCGNLGNYCGGTFKGIIEDLDYIEGMGFDAIWISPVIDNTDGGYHGYWGRRWYEVNSHFGTENDLKNLVKECHKRGIWVMVDVVANHVGPVGTNYTTINPFNKSEHYHTKCKINDWNNQWQVENCRLCDLPDLNHENPWVAAELCRWVRTIITKFDFDGIRIDSVPEVPKWFWSTFTKYSGVFSIGEVFNGKWDYNKGYIGPLDSVLNYPIYWDLRDSFKTGNLKRLAQTSINIGQYFGKDLQYMGTFVDNHDNERFLNSYGIQDHLLSATIFSLFFTGIPFVYYGTEQGYGGGKDPANREILWNNLNTNHYLYKSIKKAIEVRKSHKVWNNPYTILNATNSILAFSRGDVLIVLNVGVSADTIISNVPFPDGSKICDALNDDCTKVSEGQAHIHLKTNKSAIYVIQ